MRESVYHFLKKLRNQKPVKQEILRYLTFKADSTNRGVIYIAEQQSSPVGGFELPLMNLNSKMVQLPTTTPVVPPVAMSHIGLLAIAWGEYEQYFDRTLSGLCRVGSVEPPGWRTSNYQRRRELFRQSCGLVLGSNENLKDYYLKVADDSVILHRIRNLIVHGRCATRARIPEAGQSLQVELLFDSGDGDPENKGAFFVQDIERVAYQILHLSGRLKTFSRENVEAPTLSEAEKAFALKIWSEGQISADILAKT